MTARAKAAGMHALGVDHFVDKARVKAAVSKMDLLDPEHQKSVLEEISQGRIDVLFAAPPCGTASAAQNIRVQNLCDRLSIRMVCHGFEDSTPSVYLPRTACTPFAVWQL